MASKPIQNDNQTFEMVNSIDSSYVNNVQKEQILKNINQFDGYFTENCGQVENDDVQFYVQDGSVWFTDDGVWFELREYADSRGQESGFRGQGGVSNGDLGFGIGDSGLMTDDCRLTTNDYKRVVLKQEFIGANQVQPVGHERLSWNSNFFYGNDSSKWCTDVPNFQEIIYENIYEKIDLRYYSSEKGLKYDFIIHPGGEPDDIRINYEGAQELVIDPSGDLVIKTQFRDMVDSNLFIYQNQKNDKKFIDGKFRLFTSKTYGFEIIGEYNKNKAIIIDPLVYSTFVGGSNCDGGWNWKLDIAVDISGNAFVTGTTWSSDFPNTTGAYDNTFNGSYDRYLFKLDSTGSALIYSTFIGGSSTDWGIGIAIDTTGNAYMTGFTGSSDFPTTSGAYNTNHNSGDDVFVLKLNPTGSALIYSTYVGGNGIDNGYSIAIDASGNAYVTGFTESMDFPTTSGAYERIFNGGYYDVFVFKLNQTGAALSYSTYIGGGIGNEESGLGIAVDTAGNIYATGYTQTSDFPTTPGAYNTSYNGGGHDIFVLKLNPTGNGKNDLIYSTYFGGNDNEGGWDIIVDNGGNIYVVGGVRSVDFPITPNANDTTFNGECDGFVLKLSPVGTGQNDLIYSTYIGGDKIDECIGIAIDTLGNAYVTGNTYSSDFPTTPGALNVTYNGAGDGFMFILNQTGAVLLNSTYIGGDDEDYGFNIVVDKSCSAYVSGSTESSNFFTTSGAYDTTYNGGWGDAFVLKIGTPFSPLFLSYPKITPLLGNTSTEFNYTVDYFHLSNSPPTGVKVYIDGVGYSMLEVNNTDNNYLDGKSYFLNIIHLDVGEHTCSFWASNGTKTTTTWEIKLPKVINTPPKIVTQNTLTAYEDTYYNKNYEFEDMDVANIGQPISWNFNTNASWLKFVSKPPSLYGTPTNDDVGKYWVHIVIDDTKDTDETNFTLAVIDMNDKPIIKTKNVEQIYEDEFYEVDYNAIDIDSPIKKQSWSLDSNTSSWLHINSSSGVLNGTPNNNDVGVYWVNVTVNDNEGGFDSTNFTLTIINVNDPPVITTEDITYARVGDFYKVDYEAIDVDNQVKDLTWTITTNASWLTFNEENSILNGTPKFSDIGWYNVNISVFDGDGGYDCHKFILNVFNRFYNDPPTIVTADLEEIMVNEFYEVDYNATDDHTPSDQLIWYLETNASWLSMDMITGVLSGTPTKSEAGSYWVNITVWDVEDGWTKHNFILRVKKEPVTKNNAPILSKPTMSPEGGDTKTEFTFTIHYYDLEGDAPIQIELVMDIGTYDLELLLGTAANGTYGCTIKLPKGEHKYSFSASDGKNEVNTNRYSTPFIDQEEVSKSESGSMGFIIITIILIIIVLILLFIMLLRKRKKEKDAKGADEGVTPIVQPTEMMTPVYGQEVYTSPYMSMETISPITYQDQAQPQQQPTTTYPDQSQLQPLPQQQPMQTTQPPQEPTPAVMPMVIPSVSETEQPTVIEQPVQQLGEPEQAEYEDQLKKENNEN